MRRSLDTWYGLRVLPPSKEVIEVLLNKPCRVDAEVLRRAESMEESNKVKDWGKFMDMEFTK